jgi:hypothetical protein
MRPETWKARKAGAPRVASGTAQTVRRHEHSSASPNRSRARRGRRPTLPASIASLGSRSESSLSTSASPHAGSIDGSRWVCPPRSSVTGAGSSSQPSKLGCGRTMASSRDANKTAFPVLRQPGEVTGSRWFRAQFCAAIRTPAQQLLSGSAQWCKALRRNDDLSGRPVNVGRLLALQSRFLDGLRTICERNLGPTRPICEPNSGLSSDARAAARAGALRLPSVWRISGRLPCRRQVLILWFGVTRAARATPSSSTSTSPSPRDALDHAVWRAPDESGSCPRPGASDPRARLGFGRQPSRGSFLSKLRATRSSGPS